jgi:arsenate reductase
MASPYTLWYNPRCSKCRQALELLRSKKIEPELRLYLEETPSVAEMQNLLQRVGGDVLSAVRVKEPEFRAAKLQPTSTLRAVAQALAASPTLIERPILVKGEKAVVGRPPERVLELL